MLWKSTKLKERGYLKLYFSAQEVKLDFGFGPQLVLSLTGLPYAYLSFSSLSIEMLRYSQINMADVLPFLQ